MKKLTTIFLLLGNTLFAQVPTQQKATQFDKFINKPEIEWAAYINDTIRFTKNNLNILLFNRLKKGEIKVSMPVGSGSYQADQISYLKKKDIDEKLLFISNNVAVYDSAGNMMSEIKKIPIKIDSAEFSLTDATQILYVQNGQLKTYVTWVATMKPVITSTGKYLGDGDYFSTCFNLNYNYKPSTQNKIIWLAQAKKKISLDSFYTRNKLKELYGRNLLQTLWPYILKNKISVFDVENNNKLIPEDLTTDLINESKLPVPVYDSAGNQTGKFYKETLLPDVFTSMELLLDWYYDQTNNIVFTKIKEANLFARKWAINDEPRNESAILKLVFQ